MDRFFCHPRGARCLILHWFCDEGPSTVINSNPIQVYHFNLMAPGSHPYKNSLLIYLLCGASDVTPLSHRTSQTGPGQVRLIQTHSLIPDSCSCRLMCWCFLWSPHCRARLYSCTWTPPCLQTVYAPLCLDPLWRTPPACMPACIRLWQPNAGFPCLACYPYPT